MTGDEITALLRDRDYARTLLSQLEVSRAENAALRVLVEALQATLGTLRTAFDDQKTSLDKVLVELQASRRKIFGKSSEKLPSPKDAIKKADGTEVDPKAGQEKRKARVEQRDKISDVRQIPVSVAPELRCCPHCKGTVLKTLGAGRTARIIEYVPPKFVYENHVLETLACPCGEYVVAAEPPDRVFDKSPFGPRLISHVIVSKLLDAIPHHRLSKSLARQGVPLSRQTMTDLLHRAAEILEPLVARMFLLIAAAEIVQADETTQRRQDSRKLAYVWTFLAEVEKRPLIAYRFATDRSGDTPVAVLGTSAGYLLVDMYSGYNKVTAPKRRRRAACWAHVRRRFWELKQQFPEADEMIAAILDLYRVEYEAEASQIIGTDAHLRLRLDSSFPIVLRIRKWLRHHHRLHPPRSPLGQAIRYALGNFRSLMTFLHHPGIRLDNNGSEAALRPIALGRKNYLFVGHKIAGENIAVLMSLLTSCVANGINPEAYLTDVLLRVATQPVSDIDGILPHRWKPPA